MSAQAHRGDDSYATIESLLLGWQSTAEHDHLERLVAAAHPIVERVAKVTLLGHGIRDAFAVDEAISLVLDHLRRLPGAQAGERTVTPFTPEHTARCSCGLIDSGRSYVVWLARERAADVARSRRRRSRTTPVFSQLDKPETSKVRRCIVESADTSAQADLCVRLRHAIPRLPDRERTVIELLLEGKSQAVIAHLINVCEGTVSRIRARALVSLRDLLAE